MQAVGGQVRVTRQRLGHRLGVNTRNSHQVVSWTVEDASDIISKHGMGAGRRAGYDRLTGKACSHDTVEFGEKFHHKCPTGSRRHEEQLEGGWVKASSGGRSGEREKPFLEHPMVCGERPLSVGWAVEHSRRASELESCNGCSTWRHFIRVRFLTEEEMQNWAPLLYDEEKRLHPLHGWREDFVTHGFTQAHIVRPLLLELLVNAIQN